MVKYIILSAGHGGTDPGAVGNGYKEHELALDFVKALYKYLRDNYKGHDTRYVEEKDSKGNFKTSAQYWQGHSSGGGYSFHFNASTSINANGTEVLQGKYGNARPNAVNKALAKFFSNRGVKKVDTNDFYMLRAAGFDGIFEICFISSASDMKEYNKNKTKIVAAVGDAIAKVEGLERKIMEKYYFEVNEKLYNGYVLKATRDTYVYNDFDAKSTHRKIPAGTLIFTYGGSGTNEQGYYMHKTTISGQDKYVAFKRISND